MNENPLVWHEIVDIMLLSILNMDSCGFELKESQELISDSYPHSLKAVFAWGQGPKIYLKKSNVKFVK